MKIVQLSSSFDYTQAFSMSSELLLNNSLNFEAAADRTKSQVEASIVSLVMDEYGEDSNIINTSNGLLFLVADDFPEDLDYVDDTLTITRSVDDKVSIPYTTLSVESKYIWGSAGLAIGYLLGK